MSEKNEIDRLQSELESLQNELSLERKYSERLKLALKAVQDGLWDYNAATGDTYFSPQYYTMLGYEPYELPQSRETWCNLLHPDDRESTIQHVDECIAQRKSWAVEFRLRAKNGSYRWILGRGTVLTYGKDGQLIRRIGTHTDITEFKKIETRLLESEKRYKSIFSMMPAALWEDDLSDVKTALEGLKKRGVKDIERYLYNHRSFVADLANKITVIDVNPTAISLFEADNKKQLIEGFSRLFTSKTMGSFISLLTRLANDERSFSLPFHAKTLKGNFLTVRLNIAIVPGYEDTWSRILTTQMDITELLVAKEQAEIASKSKSMFLANMSHDLRTPINGIMGMLQLLQLEDMEASQQEYVEMGINSCKKLTALLNDILDLSKIEAGKLSVSSSPFKPSSVFQLLNEMFSLSARGKDLELRYNLDKTVPKIVVGDERRLFQILMNLVGNSIKFSQSGTIYITMSMAHIRNTNGTLLISVSDTGIGIEQDKLATLFEPFYQAESSIAREGSGLGLAIVRKLVALMGGGICVESQEGVGTAFHLHIPFAFSEFEVGKDKVTVLENPSEFIPFSALVVEDDSISGLVITTLLKNLGGRVDYAATGKEGLEKLRAHTYDVLILDVQLPDTTGLKIVELLRTASSFKKYRYTPVIALTANAMSGDRERCLNAGMTDYLSKPIDRCELITTLEKYIRKN